MEQATALVGGHTSANVTALDWHPITGSADATTTPLLLLASGDADGRVIIWDVLQGTPIAALEDAFYAGFGSSDGGARRADSARVPVKGLAWSTAQNLLTILLAPGFVMLWDYRSGGVIWRKDLGPSDAFNSVLTDPYDRRRVVLSTPRGAFVALRFDAPSADKIKFQRFQAEISSSGTLTCALPGTRDILLLVLQRELIAFDLEYGQPVATTSLPSRLPALDSVLGSFGHSVAGVSPVEAGIDALYCSHVDGSISTWQRKQGHLEYSLISHFPLTPAVLAKAAGFPSSTGGGGGGGGNGGSSGASPSSLVAIVAAIWPSPEIAYNNEEKERAPAFHVLKKKPFSRTISDGDGGSGIDSSHIPGHIRPMLPDSQPKFPHDASSAAGTAKNASVLVLALVADGDVWQWQLPLLSGTAATGTTIKTVEESSSSESLPEARLLGCHHSLSHTVTAFSAFPGILALPNRSSNTNTSTSSSISIGSSSSATTKTAGVFVVGTAAGTLELVTIQRGRLIPLTLSVATSLAVHPQSTPVVGLRWLGPTSRVASFSNQRSESTGDWVNTIMITDFKSGGSFPFRDGGLDKGPLTGLRASPSGVHLLLLFKGLPSEVWATPKGAAPFRLRQIDLSFTSVEWILPDKEERKGDDTAADDVIRWKGHSAQEQSTTSSATFSSPSSPSSSQTKTNEPPLQHSSQQPQRTSPKFPSEDFPEEKIVFTLSDGRVGVLSVYGRRIHDTKPRMPSWPQLASGEFRATCAASYSHLVFLGGSDGLLVRWDTLSGRTLAVDAGCGRIHGLVIAPISQKESFDQSEIARVAVLATSGAYAVLALDITGQLRPTAATWGTGGATLGRAQGIDWMSLPQPYGSGCVLAVATESGSLALVDVTGKRKENYSGRRKKEKILDLVEAPRLGSPLLLPRYLRLVLKILIQRGVPAALLRNAVEVASPNSDGYNDSANSASPGYLEIESELRARLPRGCATSLSPTAADSNLETGTGTFMSPRSTSSGEVAATGSMAALLESGGGGRDIRNNNSSGGGGSPLGSGSGIEQAAIKLGYSGLGGKSGSGSETNKMEKLKSFGGAVKTIAKDVASVGKDQLNKRLRANSGPIPEDFDASMRSSSSSLHSTEPRPQMPVDRANLTVGNNRENSFDTLRCGSLVAALAKCAQLRCLEYPLSDSEMGRYEAAVATGNISERMELAAMIGGCPEEAQFWKRLPASFRYLKNITRVNVDAATSPSISATGGVAQITGGGTSSRLTTSNTNHTSSTENPSSSSLLLWNTNAELAEATERSNWHSKLSRRIFEMSESLQEKRVLEFLSLGDLQAAVGFLLSSPPGTSARFYRDALCTLGMAFACGLSSTQHQPDSTITATATTASASTAVNNNGGSQVLDAAARTLFVQAAKIVSANAAGVGDTLLGVPLMCATGEFNDAVNILQDAGMWSYAAALAAGSLSHAARAAPLDRWALHVADAEGRLWGAAGLLVGAGLLGDAAKLLVQNGLADAAAALIHAAKEEQILVHGNSGKEEGETTMSQEVVGIEIDEKTCAAVEASYESFISHVLQNL